MEHKFVIEVILKYEPPKLENQTPNAAIPGSQGLNKALVMNSQDIAELLAPFQKLVQSLSNTKPKEKKNET
jgi:hypothetical protein